jgi:hypothetical protein
MATACSPYLPDSYAPRSRLLDAAGLEVDEPFFGGGGDDCDCDNFSNGTVSIYQYTENQQQQHWLSTIDYIPVSTSSETTV